MKLGVRKPSLKKSIKARTTGILGIVFGGFTTLLGLISLPVGGIIFVIGGILLFSLGFYYKKISKNMDE